ncbi:MAG: hypothetical protein GDA51_08815 [Ekhidna sp.]|nr:hypothetical protein [Ekhidna sp.]MBC6409106.1 hypothetical protein [Ekhidna sp.]MBC6426550.1 hypothetical protein [Ekhidna sp.]
MGKIQIEEAFKEAREGIAGLKAISVVEVETGLAIDSMNLDKAFDIDAASAYNSEVLKAKIKAKNAMGMEKEEIDLILIELTTQNHLIQPSPNGKYLVYIATDKSSSNIGITRRIALSVGKKVQEQLK